jgi:hypothetical protein
MPIYNIEYLQDMFYLPGRTRALEDYEISEEEDSHSEVFSDEENQYIPILENVEKRLRSKPTPIAISKSHREMLTYMSMVMAQTVPLKKPVIVTARPGLGKTEMLIATLIEKSLMYPDYTALVVVAQVRDAVRVREAVNIELHEDVCFVRPSFALMIMKDGNCLNGHVSKDYHPSICSDRNCKEQSCEAKERYWSYKPHKIYIITSMYFNRMLDDGKLDDIREFKDIKTGNITSRPEFYIDENPGMIFNPRITNNILNHCKVHLLKNKFEQKHIDEFIAVMGTISKQMGGAEQYEYAARIDSSQKLSTGFKQAWRSKPHKKYFELPEMINAFVENGGIKGNGSDFYDYAIGSNRYRKISGEGLRTVILDGTGVKDLTYKTADFNILDSPEIRNFSRGTIHYYPKSVSKSFLKASNTRAARIEAIATEALQHIGSKKALFITDIDSEKYFKKRFKDTPNIETNHFGNLIGRNDFSKCTVVVFAGVNDWGELEYLNQMDAVVDGNIELAVTAKPTPRFVDQDVKEFYFTLLAVGLFQDLMRSNLRMPSSKDDVQVYLWTHNVEIVMKLAEWLPGSQVISQPVPVGLRTSRQPKVIATEAIIKLDKLKESMAEADFKLRPKQRYEMLAKCLGRPPYQIEVKYIWEDATFNQYSRHVGYADTYLKSKK